MTAAVQEQARVEFAPGGRFGLDIPAHREALGAAGPDFLTRAFHAFGVLGPDNRVIEVTRLEPFAGGNSGSKAVLSATYAHPAPDLPTELFVKFSRDFADAFRDRRRFELEAEVRLAILSRHPSFPVAVPTALFADFDSRTGVGVLITERIAFGRGGVEPLLRKCMDHELADPLAYYRALVAALARLVAGHKSGRLSPEVETLFPFDAVAAAADLPVPWSEAELRACVGRYADFVRACPNLIPAPLADPAFIAKLEADAVRLLRHEADIRRFLHADPDLIALCHWNTNIDNAWFWRDGAGELQAGLLDWGMVRQMNVGYGLWGGLCGANPDIWEAHLDDLLVLFIDTLHAHGGPRLGLERLKLHLDLSAAMLGLALMMDAPTLVLTRLPEAVEAKGPLDPVMFRNEVARSFLHVFKAFLSLWRRHDFGAGLDRMLALEAT